MQEAKNDRNSTERDLQAAFQFLRVDFPRVIVFVPCFEPQMCGVKTTKNENSLGVLRSFGTNFFEYQSNHSRRAIYAIVKRRHLLQYILVLFLVLYQAAVTFFSLEPWPRSREIYYKRFH